MNFKVYDIYDQIDQIDLSSLQGSEGVWYVSSGGNDTTALEGSQINTYSTITAAVEAASNKVLNSYRYIIVLDGTYSEEVLFNGPAGQVFYLYTMPEVTIQDAPSGATVFHRTETNYVTVLFTFSGITSLNDSTLVNCNNNGALNLIAAVSGRGSGAIQRQGASNSTALFIDVYKIDNFAEITCNSGSVIENNNSALHIQDVDTIRSLGANAAISIGGQNLRANNIGYIQGFSYNIDVVGSGNEKISLSNCNMHSSSNTNPVIRINNSRLSLHNCIVIISSSAPVIQFVVSNTVVSSHNITNCKLIGDSTSINSIVANNNVILGHSSLSVAADGNTVIAAAGASTNLVDPNLFNDLF